VNSLSKSDLVASITAQVLKLQDEGIVTPIVLIDGRSASGKTTFAEQLQSLLFKEGETLPRVVHMDDLYEGWTGLQAGHDCLLRNVLTPVVARKRASWQEFDWYKGERDRWREFEGGTPLIVEGCGSLSQATAPLAHIRVWLNADERVRHDRWIMRSGHDHDEFWPVWAAQELEFYARERSAELADYTLEND